MRIKFKQNYSRFIVVYLVKNGDLIKLFDTVKPTDTMIDKHIESESANRDLGPLITGKGIQNILNGGTKTPREETLNFIANLFHVSPKTFIEFRKLWSENEITEEQLQMPQYQQLIQVEEEAKKPKIAEVPVALDKSNHPHVDIKQINILSAFSVSRVNMFFGKIRQLNILGYKNKQEVEDGD